MIEHLQHSTVWRCDGFCIGRTVVPPFEIRRGEIVKIAFPSGFSREMHDAVRLICSEFGDESRTATVNLPMPPAWWREAIHRQTAAEWLIENCQMTRQDAEQKLMRLSVNPDTALCMLAGNPRWMIGLIAAMQQRPAALIFTTTGCDPLGMQRALKAADAQLEDCAGVYLNCFPDLNIVEPEYAAVVEAQPVQQRVA